MLAHVGREEMHDHIAIIQQRPAAALAAQPFGVQGTDVLLNFEFFLEQVFNRLRLALVVDGGDDEVGGNTGEFVDV